MSLGARVYWHTSEDMHEVEDGSAQLVIGASVYLGKAAPWDDYAQLYRRVYIENGLRVLARTGYLLIVQTDAYVHGEVLPRNVFLPQLLLPHYRLLDTKVWRRRQADFFQVPYSLVWIFGMPEASRTQLQRCREYFPGIWDYPQTKGGALNGWPAGLCRLVIDAFTAPGDLIVDPFAGSATLLGMAAREGRRAVGYEIDEALRSVVERNLAPDLWSGL